MNRINIDMKQIILLLALVAATGAQARVRFDRLRCEYQTQPLDVDTQHPRFTWTYQGDSTFVQQAYQLRVARSPRLLKKGEGQVVTSRSMSGTYQGQQPLESCTTYFWQIVSWDQRGRRVESPVQTFTTALMNTSEWQARWISDEHDSGEEASPILRRDFTLTQVPRRALLYLSAAAYAYMTVNGQRLSSSSLNPGYTHYDKRNLYNVYDVTALLHRGENQLLAVLGNGFYNNINRTGVWQFESAPWRGRPRMICELHLTDRSGHTTLLPSDERWMAATGGCYQGNDIYSGDYYDARQQSTGLQWRPATVVEAPSPLLKAQHMPLTLVDSVYEAVSVRNLGDTLFLYDFGMNMSGYCRLHVRGPRGTQVSIQHGEELDSEGRLTVNRIRGLYADQKEYRFQTDRYTLSGEEDVLQPEFTYHGYRYVEVRSSAPITLQQQDAQGLFVHTAFQPVGQFCCSDEVLNQLWKGINQSYLSNFMSIPTDCPQREKNGWTADAHCASELGLLNYDAILGYEKWMNDHADNQRPDGQIADIIPSGGWGYGVNPTWSASMFIIPMNLYRLYGDLTAIRTVLPLCQKYLQFIRPYINEQGLVPHGLGDWVPYETSTPESFTTTCYCYLMARHMARFMQLTQQDATAYEALATAFCDSLNRHCYDAATGLYANGSQCAQALALYVGIVPEARRQQVADQLSRLVRERGNHLDFGMIGSKTVMRILSEYGYVDQALEMALQPDAPSFAAWLKAGYTTPPEEWIAKGGSSLNHVFLGDIDAWMYQYLAGINPDDAQGGMQHIIIRPYFPRQLSWVRASYQAVTGRVESAWQRSGHQVTLQVTIPVNATATVVLQGRETHIGAGRHTFTVDEE